jgi:digeranylgeranylglycerophospholipid reductase
LTAEYDVVVAGGSIAGLTFAAEASKRGLRVIVLEEHEEIGEPEKCDGLVSLRLLKEYKYLPHPIVVQNRINEGIIHSPGGKTLALDTSSLDLYVLDRSSYDKQVAREAQARGATIRTGSRVRGCEESDDGVRVVTGERSWTAKYYIDATGPASSPKRGIIPAAKYEIAADWIGEHSVEVFLDTERYPGFFAWVIPFGPHHAKVGAAGRSISPFPALDEFLTSRPHRVLRKVAAPIYIGGPASEFVLGRRILVGESAGLTKPTTAGGIVTSVVGAVIAARRVAEAIEAKDASILSKYRSDWESRFGKEMRNMLRLRGVFEKLSNSDLDSLMKIFSSPKLLARLSNSDFDFHATAVLGALGVRGVLALARIVASTEARSLLTE